MFFLLLGDIIFYMSRKSMRAAGLAREMGVTPQTIRKWMRQGKIPFHRTPGGIIFFTAGDLDEILGSEGMGTAGSGETAFYVRSSSGSKPAMEEQVRLLKAAHGEPVQVYRDSASGLNENRKGLWKMLSDAHEGVFSVLAVTYPDRLARFGVKYISEVLKRDGVTVDFLMDRDEKPAGEELVQDFMSLIASFSGRFYRMRSRENQKKLLSMAEEELESSGTGGSDEQD